MSFIRTGLLRPAETIKSFYFANLFCTRVNFKFQLSATLFFSDSSVIFLRRPNQFQLMHTDQFGNTIKQRSAPNEDKKKWRNRINEIPGSDLLCFSCVRESLFCHIFSSHSPFCVDREDWRLSMLHAPIPTHTH